MSEISVWSHHKEFSLMKENILMTTFLNKEDYGKIERNKDSIKIQKRFLKLL